MLYQARPEVSLAFFHLGERNDVPSQEVPVPRMLHYVHKYRSKRSYSQCGRSPTRFTSSSPGLAEIFGASNRGGGSLPCYALAIDTLTLVLYRAACMD